MRRKKVWRFYCEFCKKSGCSGGHISKHEKRCTNNPDRFCGMCKMQDLKQPSLQDMKALLPNPDTYAKQSEYGIGVEYVGLDVAVEEVMEKFREAAGFCPACIMAALRQKGIPVPLVTSFNFTAECKEWWAEFNEANRDYDY